MENLMKLDAEHFNAEDLLDPSGDILLPSEDLLLDSSTITSMMNGVGEDVLGLNHRDWHRPREGPPQADGPQQQQPSQSSWHCPEQQQQWMLSSDGSAASTSSSPADGMENTLFNMDRKAWTQDPRSSAVAMSMNPATSMDMELMQDVSGAAGGMPMTPGSIPMSLPGMVTPDAGMLVNGFWKPGAFMHADMKSMPPLLPAKRQRSAKKPIPEDQKDERYYERRRRNNEAAKKSRNLSKVMEEASMTITSRLGELCQKMIKQVRLLNRRQRMLFKYNEKVQLLKAGHRDISLSVDVPDLPCSELLAGMGSQRSNSGLIMTSEQMFEMLRIHLNGQGQEEQDDKLKNAFQTFSRQRELEQQHLLAGVQQDRHWLTSPERHQHQADLLLDVKPSQEQQQQLEARQQLELLAQHIPMHFIQQQQEQQQQQPRRGRQKLVDFSGRHPRTPLVVPSSEAEPQPQHGWQQQQQEPMNLMMEDPQADVQEQPVQLTTTPVSNSYFNSPV